MYKRGKNWVTDFHYGEQRYIRSWGNISRTIAKEKEDKFKTEIREGKHSLKAKKILFETFSEKYLTDTRINKRKKSADRNETSIKSLNYFFKGKEIGLIHPFMVEQYKKARLEEGKVPATVNRDFSTLHNMLNKAVEWGHIKYNPLTVVKILDEDNEVMWVLTVDEEAKLLTACEKSNQRNGGKYLKDLVLFALHSAKKRMLILRIDLLLSDIQRLKNHGRFLSMTP